jgi:hypothetical protein
MYLLKYTMKCEPSGTLNLSPDLVRHLGLGHLTPQQCRLAAALWMTKPIVPTEAAVLVLGIPMVQQSRKVDAINTAPPLLRMRVAGFKFGGITTRPVDDYMNRPPAFEDMACRPYLRRFVASTKRVAGLHHVGEDAMGKKVHDRLSDADGQPKGDTDIVRFTEYHPRSQPEAFFYNILLDSIPFRDEADLLSPDNKRQSYMTECVLRGIVKGEENIQVSLENVDKPFTYFT